MPEEAADRVNIASRFATITEAWRPQVVGELNGQQVKLVRVRGEFIWHHHAEADELFLVTAGRLRVDLRDRTVTLDPGEFFIVPRGVEHRTSAAEEACVIVFEPAHVRNTGNAEHPILTAPLP